MANIDSTVLAAILMDLSDCSSQEQLWDELTNNRSEKERNSSAMNRFFRGSYPNKKRGETTKKAWWPKKDRVAFEGMVAEYFLCCVTEETLEERREQILAKCRALRISLQEQETLKQKETPAAIIDYMMRCAKAEWEKQSAPQLSLGKQANEEAAIAGSARLEQAPLMSHGQVEEGCILTGLHESFLRRKACEDSPFFRQSAALSAGGQSWRVLYKELFGHPMPGRMEYVEGRNLTFHYEDWTADFRSRVTQVDFDREVEVERQAAAALGYTQHPPKLCLSHYLEQKLEDENGTPSSSLHLTFGQSGYLEHRVYRKEAEKNKGEQDAFRNIILAPKGNNSYFYQCPWAACGGGTWVVTRDHYLAVSFRTRVAEESGKLGYSSSGSYGRYTAEAGERKDNTPGLAMCKELAEEIGLIDLVPGDLTLISLGIDLNRYLIQFSYRLESPLTAQQLADRRAEWATTADEQILFFVPLERPDAALALLTQCEFEPGAAYSLYRLLQKRFGAL